MRKLLQIITYMGLAIVLAGIGVIIYLNIQDAKVQPLNRNLLPQRTAASPTTTSSLPPMNESMQTALNAISSERMFSTLEELTAIQAHSGWRGGGTQGEKEALDLLQSQLAGLTWLSGNGMEIERESFNVFLATESHATLVILNDGTQDFEIPADAIRGSRDDPSLAANHDTDGSLEDSTKNPVSAQGEIVLIPDDEQVRALSGSDQRGKVLLVSFSTVDTTNPMSEYNARQIMAMKPAAVILVTQNSTATGVSHGSFAGDGGGVIQRLPWIENTPLLFIELENLQSMGITDWGEMEKITSARVNMDVDVKNPGESGNLIVHIPGKSSENPVLISAHIDSPNSPGALDDGSGSSIVLEIATVLNEQQIQPESDLYIAWFGSEEIGGYGSMYFTTTHSDLVSRLQANVQIDCLSRPLDGLPAEITLMFSHVSSSGIYNDPLGKYMTRRSDDLGIDLNMYFWPFASDNGSLSAFNVPNLNMIYESDQMNNYPGGVWVAGHFHDPYDTVSLAREMESTFVEMAKMAMSVALIPANQANFVDHAGDKKAVILSNHMEAPQMTPAGFPEFSLALIDAGYQISVIPYGHTLTAEDLEDADLAVVMPVYDFPLENGTYDANWTEAEAEIINAYAQDGGRVLVVNSGHRLKLYNRFYDENEDWADLNLITDQWGVHFSGLGSETDTLNVEDHGLMKGISTITIIPENAVSFRIDSGEALAGSSMKAYLAHIEVGKGEVIVLGDLSALGEYDQGLINRQLVLNLANWE